MIFELNTEKSDIKSLIDKTRSSSGVFGPELCKAHFELGKELSRYINVPPEDTTVIAMLRGGIYFASGLYFGLGCQFDLFDPKRQKYTRPETEYVILTDSVINTGKTVKNLIGENTIVASCVTNRKALPLFENTSLYTVRISDNSFVGSNVTEQKGNKGPDTTMRLFSQLHTDKGER